MKQELKARYPAPASVIIKMMTDPKFYTDRLERGGHQQYEVLAQNADPNLFSVKIRRKLPMQIPAAIRKFVSPETTLVTTDSWNAKTRAGKITVDLQGIPVDLSAMTSLADQGDGCVLTYVFEIKARIPLVGGILEKTIAAEQAKEIPEQTRLGVELLENYL